MREGDDRTKAVIAASNRSSPLAKCRANAIIHDQADHQPGLDKIAPCEPPRIAAEPIRPFQPDLAEPSRRDRCRTGEVFEQGAAGPDAVHAELCLIVENPSLLAP